MTYELLVTVVILESTAAIMLSILSIVLLRNLRQKTKTYHNLLENWDNVEKENEQHKRRETQALADRNSSREWFRSVLGNMQEIVLAHTLDEEGGPGPIVEANETACRLLGYDRETLLSLTLADIHDVQLPAIRGFLTSTEFDEQTRRFARKVIKSSIDKVMWGKHFTYEDAFRTRHGNKLPLQLTVMRIDLSEQPVIVWIGHDLTETRRSERVVKESKKHMEDFFSHSPLGIAIFDADRRLTMVNRAGFRMFGMPDPREFEHFRLLENRFLSKDTKEALNRGESVHCEIVVDFEDVRKQGMFSSVRRDKAHFIILISNLGYDSERRPRGFFAQIEDVTERRRIEADLRRMQTAATGTGLPEEGISGSLEDVALVDMIQVLCAGGRNMQIVLNNHDVKAEVFMQAGSITHCTIDDKSGEEAFYEIMGWKEGKFTAKSCEEFPPPSITVSAMSLLMEGARRLDEVKAE